LTDILVKEQAGIGKRAQRPHIGAHERHHPAANGR
jgi:hypothetical protein